MATINQSDDEISKRGSRKNVRRAVAGAIPAAVALAQAGNLPSVGT
jgi:hypothetical protein